MKERSSTQSFRFIVLIVICVGTMVGRGVTAEPLMPPALNELLPRILTGMLVPEVEKVLATAYPGVKGRMGTWSGQTGYVDYKLTERYSLSVSSIMRNSKEVVHNDLLFYIHDWQSKRRIDVSVFDWEKNKAPPSK